MKIIHKYCDHCHEETAFWSNDVSHPVHFVLSIFTFGLWIIPWFIITSNTADNAACSNCNKKSTGRVVQVDGVPLKTHVHTRN